MSNVYSLDTLRAELDVQFAPVEIEVGRSRVVLRNVMRLSKEDRQAVVDAIGALDGADNEVDFDTVMTNLRTVLQTVAADKTKGTALVNAIGDDVALAMRILEVWTAATQPGEAENSPA